MKFAIRQKDIDHSKPYIIVHVTRTTGYDWVAVTEKSGNISDDGKYDVSLVGNYPSDPTYNCDGIYNYFICYGDFDNSVKDTHKGLPVFRVSRWDVLYPVKHDSLLPGPRSYLCRFDFS
jgi:hypothetical protein